MKKLFLVFVLSFFLVGFVSNENLQRNSVEKSIIYKYDKKFNPNFPYKVSFSKDSFLETDVMVLNFSTTDNKIKTLFINVENESIIKYSEFDLYSTTVENKCKE